MNEGEFKIQLLETEPQWKSGLTLRLKFDAKGFSLFELPAFKSWLEINDWPEKIGDLIADKCGQLYWTAFEPSNSRQSEPPSWKLFRYSGIAAPREPQSELVLDFGACGNIEPGKMWLRRDFLWMFDRIGKRVLALSRENFQIVDEISFAQDDLNFDPDVIDLDYRGNFYVLINRSGRQKICRYPIAHHGRRDCFPLQNSIDPTTLAIDRQGVLFVLDVGRGRLIRIDPASEKQESIGAQAENLLKTIRPSLMEIDQRGVIYLASNQHGGQQEDQPAALHLFDRDGNYLGEKTPDKCGQLASWDGVPLPELCEKKIKKIGGIGFDRCGGIFLVTNLGLAEFNLTQVPVGQGGLYYAKTLDNGVPEGLWHRVALDAQLPDKTSIEVSYYASDDAGLRKAYERALADDKSAEERAADIENLMQPLWKGPERFKGTASGNKAWVDLLPFENKGRYLWLKLQLFSFDGVSRPSVKAARIYYQRMSYLRYLPPVYREDPVSAAFLERFLSLFESVFHGLGLKVDQLDRYLDPRLTPDKFLPWLASWINLSVDEDLPRERLRLLIQRAPELYGRRGTPDALREFLELYTGFKVSLREHSRGLTPMVLGSKDFFLGRQTVLLGSGIKGFRLGDTSVVGHSALRDKVRAGDEPFLPLLRRFTVFIEAPRDKFIQQAAVLRRILDEHKPAHTACELRLITEQNTAGVAILGAGAAVTGTQRYQVGVTRLGSGYAVSELPEALQLERGAWVGRSLGI